MDAPTLITLEQTKQLLREKTQELLTADPGQIPALAIEVQRLRVACLMLREIENDITDPNTYREVSLLNRLLTGHDIDSEAVKKKSLEEADKATRVLEARGISPESAHRMMKALASVLSTAGTGVLNEPRAAVVAPDDDPLADEPDETAD